LLLVGQNVYPRIFAKVQFDQLRTKKLAVVLEKYCIFAKEYLVKKSCQSLISTIIGFTTLFCPLFKIIFKNNGGL